MTINELLTEHRNYYVNQFLDFQRKSDGGSTELLIEVNNDEPDEIFRLYRYDLVQDENGDPKISEFNIDGFLNHEEIQFNTQGKKLLISPIVWNGVEVLIGNTSFNFKPIIEWAYIWLDENEDVQQTNEGLTGNLHSITKPEIEFGWLSTSIDFGTAPISALIELILSDNSTICVKLQSKWMTEKQ